MSSFDPSSRTIYDQSQIAAYLDTISLPEKHRQSPVFHKPSLARSLEHGLPLLAALQKHHLASIPFENLSLHYAYPSPGVNIAPEAVHSRIVGLKCGLGGRCMENNNLLYHVLLSLGFDVVATGARVNEAVQPMSAKKNWPGPRYDGWNHRITLVRFVDDAPVHAGAPAEKVTFLADVGFGTQAPTRPMQLLKGPGHEEGQTILNVPPSFWSRVRWINIPDTVNEEQRMWVYEIKFEEGKDWIPAYCFSETEFLPRDYEMMSFFTSNSRKSWFTFIIVCTKMLLGKRNDVSWGEQSCVKNGMEREHQEEEDIIIGEIALVNETVKRRIGGKSEILETLETETQRVAALQKWFGLEVNKMERNGIVNMPTDLS